MTYSALIIKRGGEETNVGGINVYLKQNLFSMNTVKEKSRIKLSFVEPPGKILNKSLQNIMAAIANSEITSKWT